jgi:lysophospholipase L1-like esterase
MKISVHYLCSFILAACTIVRAEEETNANLFLRGGFANSQQVFETRPFSHVAFMGGSITEMNGYRPMMMEWLKRRFPKTSFNFTNAGISSTCSTTGAFRLKADVLSKGPVDLLFLEFAVNDDQDAHHSKDACVRGMEGIIRSLRTHNPKADLMVVYFVNPSMLETLKAGKVPLSIAAHEEVLNHYDVSAVHLAKEVADRISSGKLTWKLFGGTHPARPGNTLCANLAKELLELSWDKRSKATSHPVPKSLLSPWCYRRGRFLSPEKARMGTGWSWGEPSWKELPGRKRGRFLGISLLHGNSEGSKATLEFDGTAVGAYVLAGPDAGVLEVRVDDDTPARVDLFHRYSKGLHYPRTVMFAHDLKQGNHKLELTISGKRNDSSKGHAIRILQFCVN